MQSTGIKLSLKQLRQAANNLSMEAADGSLLDPARVLLLRGSRLVNHIANAIEFGEAYITKGHAESFDAANSEREANLHSI